VIYIYIYVYVCVFVSVCVCVSIKFNVTYQIDKFPHVAPPKSICTSLVLSFLSPKKYNEQANHETANRANKTRCP